MVRTPDNEKGLRDYLSVLRRRKVWMIGTAALILMLALSVAFGLPAIYSSTATILIEQQTVPKDLVPTTVTSYADERIQVISQRVMTTANLSRIIKKFGLYPEQESIGAMVAQMDEDIRLKTVSADVIDPKTGRSTRATIAFNVAYENRSPELAQKVAEELASLYLSENIKSRTRTTTETSTFLTEEANKLNAQITDLEAQLADFKQRNEGKLPELVQLNLQLMNRTEQELAETERKISAAVEKRVSLQSELAYLDPQGPVFSEAGQRVLSAGDRLQSLQAELVSVSARYSADHPDVRRLQKEIDALKQQTGNVGIRDQLATQLTAVRAELASTRERYSEQHPDVKRLLRSATGLEQRLKQARASSPVAPVSAQPNNPAYIQTDARLKVANAELTSQRALAEKLRSKLAVYEDRLTQTPQVEREYLQLTRSYDSAQDRFKEITKKQMEAQLAQSLESESKGERFTLIEPPQLPIRPAKPNRFAIACLGIVFAIAGGIGSAVMSEALDTSIHGRQGVIEIVGRPPLAVIPNIAGGDDVPDRSIRRMLTIVAVVATVLIALFCIHRFVTPIDVLWSS